MRLDYLAKHYGGKLLTLIKDLGNGEGAVNANIKESEIIQPTDLQSRYSKTIQTHNAVSVGASASTTRVEVDTKGYSKAAVMLSANGSAQAIVQTVMSNGITNYTLVSTTTTTGETKFFDLNGIEKISVYGKDSSGATNAITIEIALLV